MCAALLLFASAIAIMSWASARLTTALERFGTRFGLSEGLLGILAAFGADAPEICSAFIALHSHEREIGLGVVLGSNIFNLAGLLGLSAVVAGRISIGRQGLWFNGGTSLFVSAILVGLVLRCIPPGISLVLLALVLLPYVVLTAMRPVQIAHLPLPSGPKHFFETAVGHAHRDARRGAVLARSSTWSEAIWVPVTLGLVVASSFAAVRSAVSLAAIWDVSAAIVGTIILAALTSIPNVVAAVQLALDGRGAAVVSESLNSNTFNILAGVALPALLLGFAAPSPKILFAVFWLLGMKCFALGAASHRHGLHRIGGALIITLYVIFAVVIIFWR